MAERNERHYPSYDFKGCTIVITGGTGILGREIVSGLAECGATVVMLTRDEARGKAIADKIGTKKGSIVCVKADVLDKSSLERAAEEIMKKFGNVDMLINGAGGNNPAATTNMDRSFFQLKEEDLKNVGDLNLFGTVVASQVFGKLMAGRKEGVILNITSATAERPLTRIPAYSAAKAGVVNFTKWLAVHMAQEYSPNIRVNALSPGFFLTEQNRFLLTEAGSGKLTERGKKIIDHTPMGRFGEPEDLIGTVLWLLSPASKFVTGIVVQVDGGFGAYSGV
jgi:NAD(P)-dependent dehydrogenase (short-subunit alcohol dehydrogenase family)